MARKRRLRVGQRRAREQVDRLAREIRLARAQLGITRMTLARMAGVAKSTLERVEAGDPSAQLDTVAAVAAAAGLDLSIRVFPGGTPRLRDTGQLEIARAIVAIASPSWSHRLEVPAGEHGRAADLMLLGAAEILHIEIERRLADLQAQLRSAELKRQALANADPRPVRLVLAVEDSFRNRAVVQPHGDLLRSQLPGTSREILAAIGNGSPLGRDGLLWIRQRRTPRRE